MATPEAAWRERGRALGRRLHDGTHLVHWEIGEWWLEASNAWRKRVELENWKDPSVHVCKAAASVCRKFPIMRRRMDVPFEHHRKVMSLPPPAADVLLEKFKDRSSRELLWKVYEWKRDSRMGMIKGGTVADLHDLIRRREKFKTIYADLPWPFRYATALGASVRHYPSMPFEAICGLPVAELADKICHLHMWCPMALLPEALEVIRVWGFVYKSGLVWHKIKPRPGVGHYWRVTHELLLLGVRGTGGFQDRMLESFLETPVGRHSEKPEEVRKLVERASPPPRVELFARKRVKEWMCWGNEVPPLANAAD